MGKNSSSDDDSDSSREIKRRDKKERKEKKEKKEKHKKHKKKHGKDKGRDKEQERLLKEAKKFLKQKLKSGDPEAAMAAAAAAAAGGGGRQQQQQPPAAPPEPPYEGPIQPISMDDYFTKNAEFAAWLKETRGIFFSEQSTEDNRRAFAEFVAAWNAGRLPARMYKGEVGAARTSHAWGIKGSGQALARSGAVGMAAALDEDLNLKDQARAAAMAERQQQRREAKEYLEEAVPRLAGKDKQLEEKRARRELSRAGNDSPEFVARGMDVMGGGRDDFAAAKAREAARQDRRGRHQAARQADVQQRLAAHQAAEADKMAQFKALLGAGPIQIAKRQ